MKIILVPRNDGKNENPLYIFVCCCAVVHFPPSPFLERGLGGEAWIAQPEADRHVAL